MVNKQQEAKDGLVWLEKYIEQLESERDHLDTQLSAHENDLVLLDVADKLKMAEERIAELEAEQRWIPVSEWQIKEDGIYFYLDKHGFLQTAYFYANAELNTIKYYVRMVFTMRLPQPPKDGE